MEGQGGGEAQGVADWSMTDFCESLQKFYQKYLTSFECFRSSLRATPTSRTTLTTLSRRHGECRGDEAVESLKYCPDWRSGCWHFNCWPSICVKCQRSPSKNQRQCRILKKNAVCIVNVEKQHIFFSTTKYPGQIWYALNSPGEADTSSGFDEFPFGPNAFESKFRLFRIIFDSY
jgi:hypothetical protein